MDVSRDTFYRYQELVESGGIDSLISKSRRAPNIKNRVEHGVDQPAYGQHRATNELRKKGIYIFSLANPLRIGLEGISLVS